MSTVGRIGCTAAAMNVFAMSRGTPAAAFAMYRSRNPSIDIYGIVAPPSQTVKPFSSLDFTDVHTDVRNRVWSEPLGSRRTSSGVRRTKSVPLLLRVALTGTDNVA